MKEEIKELTSLEDFKIVYRVFSGPPYNEKYTEEELEEIFREYQEKGYIYGAYSNGKCVGLIALERGVKADQPVSFQDENVMYLADVAVLDEYRRRGVGNQLMWYGVMKSKEMGYDKLYMRTLERGSMSLGIALRIGFKQIPKLVQNVEMKRINGKVESMKNIFLDIDLNALNLNNLKNEIERVNPSRIIEKERLI